MVPGGNVENNDDTGRGRLCDALFWAYGSLDGFHALFAIVANNFLLRLECNGVTFGQLASEATCDSQLLCPLRVEFASYTGAYKRVGQLALIGGSSELWKRLKESGGEGRALPEVVDLRAH